MEKKTKSMGKDKGGGRQHRHSYAHNTHGGFSSRFSSGKFSGEALEKVPDPKSNKSVPMRRPKTQPELLKRDKPALERAPWLNLEAPLHLSKIATPGESANNKSCAKFVVNVSIAQSIGHLRVFVSNDATVADVIKATLVVYAREGRRPCLGSDPLSFDLHYSQFTIDCLNYNDLMEELACRNFYLCPKTSTPDEMRASVNSCGTELEKTWRMTDSWYKLMDCFLLLP